MAKDQIPSFAFAFAFALGLGGQARVSHCGFNFYWPQKIGGCVFYFLSFIFCLLFFCLLFFLSFFSCGSSTFSPWYR
jgi:tellurite resistance protein TehA-like permease